MEPQVGTAAVRPAAPACYIVGAMLLAIDIGNTQTAVGLFDGDELVGRWTLSTCADDTADEISLKLAGLLAEGAPDSSRASDAASGAPGTPRIDAACIACVVPPLTEAWQVAAARTCALQSDQSPDSQPARAQARPGRVLVVGPGVRTGLAMRFDNPAEVGADRVADAVAAVDKCGAPVVVVDLGTATNIEAVDASGAFVGGVIAPGLATTASDLASHAARLPLVDLGFPGHVIGTNTVDAMRSGIMYGELARIDGLVRRVLDELGCDAPVIATGGYASIMASLSETVTAHEPDLTLEGLRLIHERNRTR